MKKRNTYDDNYKAQALRLAKEVGVPDAAKQLGINKWTLYDWIGKAEKGHNFNSVKEDEPDTALTKDDEIKLLKKKLREYEKRIEKDNKKIAFLEEASAFFASSHPRLKKMSDLNS